VAAAEAVQEVLVLLAPLTHFVVAVAVVQEVLLVLSCLVGLYQ
jgi:hypothetical protein